VRGAIVDSATTGVLGSIGSGSPNRLVYSLLGASPGPTPACAYAESYSGSLNGAGDYDYHPNGTYFSSGSGTHRGCLIGPSGTDSTSICGSGTARPGRPSPAASAPGRSRT